MLNQRRALQAGAAVVFLTALVNAQQASQPPAQQPPTQPPAPAAAPPLAAASKCPAPEPPAKLADYSFSGTTGLLMHAVPTTKVQDFETFLGHLRDALATSTDPIVRQQAKGWTIYRDANPGPNNDVVYVFLFDPVVPCVDYGLGRIMAGAISDQAELKRVWSLYTQSVRNSSLMDLSAPGAPTAKSETPAAGPPATQKPSTAQTPPAPLDANPTKPPR